MQSTVSVRGPQPSSAYERPVNLKAGKPLREIFYDLDEFLALADGRIHYDIIRETFDAGGLLGFKVYLELSARSKEGHIVKYEQLKVLDPSAIPLGKHSNAMDALKEEHNKTVEEFVEKAKSLGATPGRWC